MKTINWEERIEDIILKEGVSYLNDYNQERLDSDKKYLIKRVIQFAEEVHNNACEQQKIICAENAICKDIIDDYHYDITGKSKWTKEIDEDSILNSPNAEFE